ncbi:hypothetical protein HDK64DRAFT_257056 [Phyllosticta capitalensis]
MPTKRKQTKSIRWSMTLFGTDETSAEGDKRRETKGGCASWGGSMRLKNGQRPPVESSLSERRPWGPMRGAHAVRLSTESASLTTRQSDDRCQGHCPERGAVGSRLCISLLMSEMVCMDPSTYRNIETTLGIGQCWQSKTRNRRPGGCDHGHSWSFSDRLTAGLDKNEALRAKRMMPASSSWTTQLMPAVPVAVSVCQKSLCRKECGCQGTAGCRERVDCVRSVRESDDGQNSQRQAVDVVDAGGVDGARLAVAPAPSRRHGFKRVIFACHDWLRMHQSLVAATPLLLTSRRRRLNLQASQTLFKQTELHHESRSKWSCAAVELYSRRIRTCRLLTGYMAINDMHNETVSNINIFIIIRAQPSK